MVDRAIRTMLAAAFALALTLASAAPSAAADEIDGVIRVRSAYGWMRRLRGSNRIWGRRASCSLMRIKQSELAAQGRD